MAAVDVCNLALLLVGEEKVTSLSDTTNKASVLANTIYTQKRNEVFDMPINWKFATTRSPALTAHSSNPATGTFDYYYVLPTNLRRIIDVIDSEGDKMQYPWARELHVSTGESPVLTPVIACNETSVYLKYIYLVDDTDKWPSWFTWLVVAKIAQVLVEPIKQDKGGLIRVIYQTYQDALRDALAGNQSWDSDTNESSVNLDYGNTDILDAAGSELSNTYPRIVER
jgi:hypothetical protein